MNLVLGVSGSVAAYRAADLARELMRSGFTVRVCLTDSAQKFVTPALFEALTGQPCLTDTFEEPERGRMAHIDWARQADAILVAPATANTLNRIAFGIGDDMLTTICLATTKPILVAPAMNPQMYLNENTQEALTRLKAKGVEVIEPLEGDVACGENGQGKLASIQEIVARVVSELSFSRKLEGKEILITSGPTEEPIDDVRMITNRSSGKMGSALAKAALRMGARVTVVAGPQSASITNEATVIRVRTAEQMLEAALRELPEKDIVIGVAAVADYRIENPTQGKIRRSGDPMTLTLIPNPDIIGTLASRKDPSTLVVGFAAEPSSDVSIAQEKIKRKNLDGLVFNNVGNSSIGFDRDENEVTLISPNGSQTEISRRSKFECAVEILNWISESI